MGAVFPHPFEADVAHVELNALPVGSSGEAAGQRQRDQNGEKRKFAHEAENTKAAPPGLVPATGREWFCNADFDLTLAHGGGKVPARLLESARSQAWHFWPALSEIEGVDTLRVPFLPPPSFNAYLEAAGIRPPTFKADDLPDPERIFTPFGWNPEALARNAAAARPGGAPPFEAVRAVNGRAFGAALEAALCGEEACPARYWATPADLKKGIGALAPGRYVAKGNHALAGVAQLRFEVGADDALRRHGAALRRLLERHGGLAVEREQGVVTEFGVLFRMNAKGRGALRVHRLWTSPEGGFAGALVLPEDDPLFAPWRGVAGGRATQIASALANEGYFGPVGLDMYSWRDGDYIRFRALVDLNARVTMAWAAHGLYARFPGRAVAVTQVSSTSIAAPKDYAALAAALGDLAFDPARGAGVLWLTPLLPLPRHSLGFIGADEAEVARLRDGTFAALRSEARA